MNVKRVATGLLLASVGMVGVAHAECVVHYARIACQGKEEESFKKCDGKPACERVKKATSKEACADEALKSCDNDRVDITKYKAITATFSGQTLVGGFDATGKPDVVGSNFCAAYRPDMNRCQ